MILYLSPSNQYANMYRDGVHNEKAVMEQIANLLKDRLSKYLITVVMPTNTDLIRRTNEANGMKADYYLSLHSNAYNGIDGRGCECGYQNPLWGKSSTVKAGSKAFATQLVGHLSKITTTSTLVNDRGIKWKRQRDGRDWNGELRRCAMPACLIEVEFHDIFRGCVWILGNLDAIAEQLCHAIVDQTGAILKVSYYPKCPYTGNSITEGLKSIGAYHAGIGAELAKANGIVNYTGTALQNTKLLNLLKQGLLIRA